MSYQEVMQMPLRAFWTFNGAVSRIRAEEDLRALRVAGAAQGGEAWSELHGALKEEQGSPVVVIDNRRDPDALDKLRQL